MAEVGHVYGVWVAAEGEGEKHGGKHEGENHETVQTFMTMKNESKGNKKNINRTETR